MRASVLGIPAGTVASRVRRARELLADAIARIGDEPAIANVIMQGIEPWAREIRDGLGRG